MIVFELDVSLITYLTGWAARKRLAVLAGTAVVFFFDYNISDYVKKNEADPHQGCNSLVAVFVDGYLLYDHIFLSIKL